MPETRDLARRFGENLVGCRERADLSQEELGFLADLHRTEIGMLERGVRLPRIDTLIKLAGALEIDPGDLLGGMSWTPGAPSVGRFSAQGGDDDAPEGRRGSHRQDKPERTKPRKGRDQESQEPPTARPKGRP